MKPCLKKEEKRHSNDSKQSLIISGLEVRLLCFTMAWFLRSFGCLFWFWFFYMGFKSSALLAFYSWDVCFFHVYTFSFLGFGLVWFGVLFVCFSLCLIFLFSFFLYFSFYVVCVCVWVYAGDEQVTEVSDPWGWGCSCEPLTWVVGTAEPAAWDSLFVCLLALRASKTYGQSWWQRGRVMKLSESPRPATPTRRVPRQPGLYRDSVSSPSPYIF